MIVYYFGRRVLGWLIVWWFAWFCVFVVLVCGCWWLAGEVVCGLCFLPGLGFWVWCDCLLFWCCVLGVVNCLVVCLILRVCCVSMCLLGGLLL